MSPQLSQQATASTAIDGTSEEVTQPRAAFPSQPSDWTNPVLAKDAAHFRRPWGTGYTLQVLRTTFPLLLADLIALAMGAAASVGLAEWVVGRPVNHAGLFWLLASFFQLGAFAAAGLYPAVGVHPAVELRKLTLTWTGIGLAAVTFIAIEGSPHSPYVVMSIGTFGVALLLSPPLRTLMRAWAARRAWWGYRTVIIGNGVTAEHLDRVLNDGGGRGLRLLGRFDQTHRYWQESADCRLEWLGSVEDAVAYARQYGVFWLVIALPERVDPEMMCWVNFFRERFRHVVLVHTHHELPSLWNRPLDCGGVFAVQVEERLMMPEQRFLKRLFDLLLVVIAGICLFPLLALVALVILVTSGRPIFFGHDRVGRDGRMFKVWKFRTMVTHADRVLDQYLTSHPDAAVEFASDHKLRNDPRITRWGRFLRKTSLDELPQILNVLRGEMSVVGPRPIQTAEIVKYGATYPQYARVRPGITGLWQINGRNNTTYEQRLMYDRFYVRNWSPWLDLYILGRTFKTVLLCEGAY